MNASLRIILGAVSGAVLGYLLYRVIGCRTGVCPLYANPYLPMIIWAVIGGLLAWRIKALRK